MKVVEWDRDLVPEHLWIAALAARYGIEVAHQPFNRLLEALEDVWPHKDSTPIGLVSDFGEIPNEARQRFVGCHRHLIFETLVQPLGGILALYPNSPASWLIEEHSSGPSRPLDTESELLGLRDLVVSLLPGKHGIVGRLRVFPFSRLVNHRRVSIRSKETLQAMARYPHKCTPDERDLVESTSRHAVNAHYTTTRNLQSRDWPKQFWRRNYELAPCKPAILPPHGTRPASAEEFPALMAALESNGKAARAYLDLLGRKVPCDLYEPARDEILFGLIARVIRLFVLMMEEPCLWARDTSGIILRCLADTAITFIFLIKCGGEEDFKRFLDYGKGQEKLLMLHLRENYPEDHTLEGRTADAIYSNLGGLLTEQLNVELGSWSKKDTRKLAQRAGLERLYRLVFSPTSADVHGSWLSLKHSNLAYCMEPLHRFHRLPGYVDPPLYTYVMSAAQSLLKECIAVGVCVMKYPPPEIEFERIPTEVEAKELNEEV